MKPLSALERLAEGLPLYNSISLPFLSRSIIGTETEFGYENAKKNLLPEFTENGGRFYVDNGHHPEWATPETKSPLAATVYELAGERLVQIYAQYLYKNIVDAEEQAWGAHENYYSSMPPTELKPLGPFLATRQIYAGAGRQKDGKYMISQRPQFIDHLEHKGTQINERGIICTKNEPHMSTQNRYRIHMILGDANRSPMTIWLKLGTTALVLRLLEEGKLPHIPYDENKIISDINEIARQEGDWIMQSTFPEKMSAVAVQRLYHSAAKKEYDNHNEQIHDLLEVWDDTLTLLEKDPSKLHRRIDWLAKRKILNSYQKIHNLKEDASDLESLDNEYHLVGAHHETPTFDRFYQEGYFERLVPEELVIDAMQNPPTNTRAWGRGLMIKYGKKLKENISISKLVDWEKGIICNSSGKIIQCEMGVPFNTYAHHAFTLKSYYDATFHVSQSVPS